MVSKLAKGDFEDLKAQGLNPTLEDFDRLNRLALPLTDGAETTCANFPRVGWAGDVPFFEPTLQAFAWYHGYACRMNANAGTFDTFWFFALAHAREPHFFDALRTPEAIEKAVREWVESLPATREEVARACRYAVQGLDEVPASSGNPRRRTSRSAAEENLSRIESQIRAACGRLHVSPDALQTETQSRISAICEAAGVDTGCRMKAGEAERRAAYDAAYSEICKRLEAEKKGGEG